MKKPTNFVKRVTSYLYRNSIQHTLSISFTLVAVIGMLLLGIIFYFRFEASTQNIARDDNKRVIEQVNLNMDTYLRSMMRISDTMYFRVIKNADLDHESIDSQINLLYDTYRDQLVSISVFDQGGALISTAPFSVLKRRAEPSDQEWFTQAMSKAENLHFSTPHIQNLFEDPNHSYKWVVSLSRSVELTHGGEVEYGVLLVDMNFSGIAQLLKNVSLGSGGYTYIIDSDGEIIYHPRQQLIYSNLVEESNFKHAAYEDGNHTEIFNGVERIVTVKTVGYTGWKIIGVTPFFEVAKDYYYFRYFAVFILFFMIIIMVFANLFISSRIADPIKALEESVKDFEMGKTDVDIFIGGSYEIQRLGETISSMVLEMNRLMTEAEAEHEAKRKAELDALQSQINPHFLYNTLDSIVWMIENEQFSEATSMVTALARLFRISLSKGKNIISVGDELEHGRNYLTIQMMRYKNKFTVEIDPQFETLNLSTMKLIIQPLLENAIYHGMEVTDGDGKITIRTYTKENYLYIDISDNGIGIPEDICKQLLLEERQIKSKGSGVGLRNVDQRIKLCFGENYGLSIYSEPDYGTTVSIKLPCIPYGEPIGERTENDE